MRSYSYGNRHAKTTVCTQLCTRRTFIIFFYLPNAPPGTRFQHKLQPCRCRLSRNKRLGNRLGPKAAL